MISEEELKKLESIADEVYSKAYEDVIENTIIIKYDSESLQQQSLIADKKGKEAKCKIFIAHDILNFLIKERKIKITEEYSNLSILDMVIEYAEKMNIK